ncbi:MAG: tRNA pseudouridine(55) synthase TruB [Cyclobacteriaceae bacterium]
MNTVNPEEGSLILVDKPFRWTSFDVVHKLRKLTGIRKIGHAGTLDPLATGLLVVCTGKFTKRINDYQGLEKEYTGTMVLGQTTPSHDLETEPSEPVPLHDLSEELLVLAKTRLTGLIDQVPPLHSAIKIDGKRAYKFARQGIEKKMEARKVEVSVFELTRIELPQIDFRIVCSKGTYIRSLVRDFGEITGKGAYMSALRRTRIGDFRVEDAQIIPGA